MKHSSRYLVALALITSVISTAQIYAAQRLFSRLASATKQLFANTKNPNAAAAAYLVSGAAATTGCCIIQANKGFLWAPTLKESYIQEHRCEQGFSLLRAGIDGMVLLTPFLYCPPAFLSAAGGLAAWRYFPADPLGNRHSPKKDVYAFFERRAQMPKNFLDELSDSQKSLKGAPRHPRK